MGDGTLLIRLKRETTKRRRAPRRRLGRTGHRAIVETGFVGSLELALRVYERSRVVRPESRCCWSVASAATSSGFWFENAQRMLELELLVSTEMVDTSFGFNAAGEHAERELRS